MKTKTRMIWILNFILSALTVLAVLAMAEQLFLTGNAWFSYIKLCFPALLCFFAGFACRNHPTAVIVFWPLSCIAAGIITALVVSWENSTDVVFFVLTLGSGAFLFFRGVRAGRSFPPMMSLLSIALYLTALVVSNASESGFDYIFGVLALVNFLLSLLSFNTESLQNGLHNIKGGEAMRIPAGLRLKNLLLLAAFVIAAFLIGNIRGLHNALGAGVTGIFYAIWYAITFMGGLFTSGGKAPAETPTPEPSSAGVPLPQPDPEAGVNIIVILLFVFIGLAFIIGIIWMQASGREDGGEGFFASLKKVFRKRNRGGNDEEYVEEIERLTNLKDLLKKRGAGIRGLFGDMFVRRERFEDMPDNRMRVRFAYKALLSSAGAPKSGLTITPLEHGERLDSESLKRLSADYSELKYAEAEAVSDDAAKNAGRAVSEIVRRSGSER